MNNHYFESGNVHFNLEQKFENVPLAAADADGIIAAIDKTETEYQAKVDEQVENMAGIFKRMRRALPVTGQKFNWSNPRMMMN